MKTRSRLEALRESVLGKEPDWEAEVILSSGKDLNLQNRLEQNGQRPKVFVMPAHTID
jgi:hypothetical protein